MRAEGPIILPNSGNRGEGGLGKCDENQKRDTQLDGGLTVKRECCYKCIQRLPQTRASSLKSKRLGQPDRSFGALDLDWMWAGTKDHVATQGAAQGEGQLLQYPGFRIRRQGIEGERGA